jgi:hypothetical protein
VVLVLHYEFHLTLLCLLPRGVLYANKPVLGCVYNFGKRLVADIKRLNQVGIHVGSSLWGYFNFFGGDDTRIYTGIQIHFSFLDQRLLTVCVELLYFLRLHLYSMRIYTLGFPLKLFMCRRNFLILQPFFISTLALQLKC